MKRFKTIELYSNIVLYGALLILICLKAMFFITAYFIMGGWQILGMAFHFINGWFMKKRGARSNYQWTVLIIIIAVLPGLAFPAILMILLYVMLLVSPFMAINYICICFSEVKELNNRKEFVLSN
jgi:hypothetical protein